MTDDVARPPGNRVVKTIHAYYTDVVEIHWHRDDAAVHVRIERHEAPAKATWAARTSSPGDEA